MNAYLDLARQGKTHWWRYLLAILLIFIMWQVVGSIPAGLLVFWTMIDGDPQTGYDAGRLAGVDQTLYFVAFMLASVAFLLGIFLAVRFIHGRPFRTLVTPARRLDWSRLFLGAAVWFVIVALFAVLEAVLYPGRYILTLDLPRFLPFAFLALILIPIQTSAEEFFFRGYLLQLFGLRLRNIWVLSLLSGLLFGLPHLFNPEASVNYFLMGLYYVSMGAVLAYVALRDGRLELVLGLHAANNLFAALFANLEVSVMPSPSIFTISELDAVYSVGTGILSLLIFAFIFLVPLRWKEMPSELPPAPPIVPGAS